MASQSETAYLRLREMILSAGVLPGEHLGEVEWAQRLGVGRFAIREGLRRLHGEGLLHKARGKHWVPAMSAQEVREVYQLRAVLEIGALRFNPGAVPPEVVLEIQNAALDYAALVEKGYFDGAREADLRFHRSLVAVSGNPRLIRLYESSNLPLLHVTVGRRGQPLDDFAISAREHQKVADAMVRGEIEEAALALEAHLKRGTADVLSREAEEQTL